MKKVYENEHIRVFWDSDKCIHIGNCTRGLPDVFNVNKRPWVNIDAAAVADIKRVVDTCPTGALIWEVPGEAKTPEVTITVFRNGPLQVQGECRLIGYDGKELEKGSVCGLCRCGASKKMPFCDGSHTQAGFKDNDQQD